MRKNNPKITASHIVNIINSLNWKDAQNKKSIYSTRDLVYSLNGTVTKGRMFETSFFSKAKLMKDDLIEHIDLYIHDSVIDFIYLQFNYDQSSLKDNSVSSIGVYCFDQDGAMIKLTEITKGKNQIIKAFKEKIEQERLKKIKRDSANKIKSKEKMRQCVMGLTVNF